MIIGNWIVWWNLLDHVVWQHVYHTLIKQSRSIQGMCLEGTVWLVAQSNVDNVGESGSQQTHHQRVPSLHRYASTQCWWWRWAHINISLLLHLSFLHLSPLLFLSCRTTRTRSTEDVHSRRVSQQKPRRQQNHLSALYVRHRHEHDANGVGGGHGHGGARSVESTPAAVMFIAVMFIAAMFIVRPQCGRAPPAARVARVRSIASPTSASTAPSRCYAPCCQHRVVCKFVNKNATKNTTKWFFFFFKNRYTRCVCVNKVKREKKEEKWEKQWRTQTQTCECKWRWTTPWWIDSPCDRECRRAPESCRQNPAHIHTREQNTHTAWQRALTFKRNARLKPLAKKPPNGAMTDANSAKMSECRRIGRTNTERNSTPNYTTHRRGGDGSTHEHSGVNGPMHVPLPTSQRQAATTPRVVQQTPGCGRTTSACSKCRRADTQPRRTATRTTQTPRPTPSWQTRRPESPIAHRTYHWSLTFPLSFITADRLTSHVLRGDNLINGVLPKKKPKMYAQQSLQITNDAGNNILEYYLWGNIFW